MIMDLIFKKAEKNILDFLKEKQFKNYKEYKECEGKISEEIYAKIDNEIIPEFIPVNLRGWLLFLLDNEFLLECQPSPEVYLDYIKSNEPITPLDLISSSFIELISNHCSEIAETYFLKLKKRGRCL